MAWTRLSYHMQVQLLNLEKVHVKSDISIVSLEGEEEFKKKCYHNLM